MTLTLPILFEGKLNCDGLIHEELPVHGLNRRIG
jgi:hypothetical protein